MKSESRNLTWAWLAAAVLFFAFGTQSAVAAIGSIVGSKHDFSTSGPNAAYKSTTTNQVCVYCHAPHATGATPLWSHASSVVSYGLYASPTLNATDMGQPGVTSKLCLSCHDGTVAVDSFGGATGTKLATGLALIGTSLADDHPIGFSYNATLVSADPGLYAVTKAVTIGTGNTGTIDTKLLFAGKMECASCHDVHNSTSGTAQESKLLRITSSASALCTTCHIK